MSEPKATPEVLSLVAPASFSWMRVFLSLVVLLVFLLIARFSPKSTSKSSVSAGNKSGVASVLLVGPLASGKTALFSRLVYGTVPNSHTSMKENEGVVKAKWGSGPPAASEKAEDKDGVSGEDESAAVVLARPLHLVDIPGHPRLRTRSLAQFLPAADGVVFVIDAETGLTLKNIREAGEHLHVVLCLLSLLSSRRSSGSLPSLLILLTKSDLLSTTPSSSSSTPTKSKSPSLALDRAKQSLARELERRRAANSTGTHSAGAKLEGLDAIPTGAGSNPSLLHSVLSLFGLGASSTTTTSSSATGSSDAVQGLPSDEAELLTHEDAFPFEGTFEWEKVERALGIEVKWAIASATERKAEGLAKVWEWIEQDV